MSSLYVMEQGTCLKKAQSQFVLNPPNKTHLEIPIREVERILVFGSVQMSASVIGTCLHQQIPVVFLSQTGLYKGHLWSAEREDLEAERQQFLRYGDEDVQLQTARAIAFGKLGNSRQLLLRLNRKRRLDSVSEVVEGMQRDIDALEMADSVAQLRGYEGIAAARYFPALGQLLVNSDFAFRERNRRPPKDPVNALLSFGYTLLFNNVMSLVLAEGLNPYLGNLHRSEKKLPELVLDLMEEWRSPVVDTLVVTLINGKVFKPEDFTRAASGEGIYLSDSARRLFVQKFEAALGQEVSHPDVQEQVSYRRAIQLQVKRYKRMLLAGVLYEAFLRSV